LIIKFIERLHFIFQPHQPSDSDRVANTAMASFNYLRRNGHVEEADLPLVMSSEEVYLPRDRDGKVKSRFVYAVRDLSAEKDEDGKQPLTTNLLPNFTGTAAFSTHITA